MRDTHEAENLALADRFFEAIPKGDVETIRSLYAPDAAIWHNNDRVAQSVDKNLRVLAWVAANVEGLRYEDVRRRVTANGWVQQHVLRGTAPNGEPLEIEACIVFTVAGGRITRLDEYLDPAQAAPLMAG